jgi:hypothetical protein
MKDYRGIKKKLEQFEYFKESKGELNIIDIISEPNIYCDEESDEQPEILDERKNLDKLKQITKSNYDIFLKIRIFTIINDLIDKDIFTPFLVKMINNIKESYEKMINEKKIFFNIDNKIEQAKENIQKLIAILSDNLDDEAKSLLDNKTSSIKDYLSKFYYDRKELVYDLFDEKITLQETMKKYIIETYEKKNFNKKDKSMDKYIEEINDHLVTPIATNKENYCFYFIFCLFREDIINCIYEKKSVELSKKKMQLDKNNKEYIDKLVDEYLK